MAVGTIPTVPCPGAKMAAGPVALCASLSGLLKGRRAPDWYLGTRRARAAPKSRTLSSDSTPPTFGGSSGLRTSCFRSLFFSRLLSACDCRCACGGVMWWQLPTRLLRGVRYLSETHGRCTDHGQPICVPWRGAQIDLGLCRFPGA
eukprot:3940624-Rhodomonas_salina.7